MHGETMRSRVSPSPVCQRPKCPPTDPLGTRCPILSSTNKHTMPATVTFAEYAAAAEARNDINQAILGHTFRLCQALEQDFVNESIRRAEFFATSNPDNKEFYENKIADLKANIGTYQFSVDTGRKYHKVMMTTDGNSRSVHCFIDKKTGEVYKAASIKAPAKGVRFNMLIIKEREFMLAHADWAGGYLYRNAQYVA